MKRGSLKLRFVLSNLHRKTWLTSRIPPLWSDSHDDLWLWVEQVPPILLIEEWIISSRRNNWRYTRLCVLFWWWRLFLCQRNGFVLRTMKWTETVYLGWRRGERWGPAKFSEWHYVVSCVVLVYFWCQSHENSSKLIDSYHNRVYIAGCE